MKCVTLNVEEQTKIKMRTLSRSRIVTTVENEPDHKCVKIRENRVDVRMSLTAKWRTAEPRTKMSVAVHKHGLPEC